MRRALLLTTICFVGLAPLRAGGEEDLLRLDAAEEDGVEASDATVEDVSGLALVDATFADWLEASRRGDALAAREAEAQVREALRAIDLAENEPMAAAALREMERRLDLGLTGADRVALFAVDLAPSFPPAHWGLAKARFRIAPLSIGGWVGPIVDGFTSYFRTERHARPLLGNLARVFVASALLAGLIAMGAGLLRNLRRFAHDLRHLLPGMPPSIFAAAIFLGGLALVGVWAGGALLWLGVGMVALAAYLGSQERWMLALFLVAAGQIGPTLSWIDERTAWGDTPAALLDAIDARGDFSSVRRLRALVDQEPARPEALFALARFEKREGRLEEAASLYDRALAMRTDWPEAMVNRANLHFAAGELERASESYERAVELDEDLAEAWFGLSRVRYRLVDISGGQEARARALELRPDLAERYNAGEEEGARIQRYLADAGLDEAALLRFTDFDAPEPALAKLLWGPLGPASAPIAGGIFGILILLLPLFGVRTSRGCVQCGAPICKLCDRGMDASETCSACVQVLSRKRGLDPAIRNQKEVEIARYARRRHVLVRVASFVGVGPFLRGKTLWGFILFVPMGVAVGGWIGGPLPPVFGDWPLALRAGFLLPLLMAIGLSVWVSRGKED